MTIETDYRRTRHLGGLTRDPGIIDSVAVGRITLAAALGGMFGP